MDTAINNGDFLLNSVGKPFIISEEKEILQQVLIRLTVKKGSFIYDPNLGSNLYTIKPSQGNINNRVLSIVREALAPMSKIIVDNVNINLNNNGENLDLKVFISIDNKKREVEITFW